MRRTMTTLSLVALMACSPPVPAPTGVTPAAEPATPAFTGHDAAAWSGALEAQRDLMALPEAASGYAEVARKAFLVRDGALTPAGTVLRDRLSERPRDGLPDARKTLQAVEGLSADKPAHAELLLFDAALTYARDMAPDPEKADLEALTAALAEAVVSADSLTAWLDGLRPANPQYARLMKQVGVYQEIVDAGGWPTKMPRMPEPTPKDPFRYKANYKRYPEGVVQNIKARLAGERLYDGEINNSWDDALTQAVLRYRKRNQLSDKAIIDYEMTRAMRIPAQWRLAQMKLNLQRLRASKLGKDPYSIWVNVPAYRGELWDKGKRQLAFRTVVGSRRKSRHKKTREWQARDATPLFSDKMESVVMAPYWTVPASIRIQLMRRAEKDPDFLKSQGYEVVKVAKGRLLRQRPGKLNALGRVKFMFPNEHDIYLHDTPDRFLFNQPMRAYSHGCIRVENPLDLALYILKRQDPEWTMRKLERRGNASVETAVTLDDGPTVHLEYITVSVADDDEIQFHWDIYHHDGRWIEKHLGLPLPGDLYYP